jgi:hypothetical protein
MDTFVIKYSFLFYQEIGSKPLASVMLVMFILNELSRAEADVNKKGIGKGTSRFFTG